MNKKVIIILIILIISLLIIGIVFSFSINKAYKSGISKGKMDLIIDQTRTSNMYFIYEGRPIVMPIVQICEGIKSVK